MVRQASNLDVFHAVACPTRRRLLQLLADREHRVSELVDALEIRQPSVSEQLRVLRDTGLVDVRQAGRERYYRVNHAGFQPLVDWMAEFSRFWDTKLDGLAKFLSRQEQQP